MPKVSVIIPVFNAEKYIERCLDALSSQTFGDFEAICVNDGSKDNSLKILKEYQKKDNRIKVFSRFHSGPANARHKAISKSQGKYIMFCDADDYYENNMIEIMVTAIEKYNTDLVMCNTNICCLDGFKSNDETIENYPILKLEGYYDITPQNITEINDILWNKIFKKELMDIHKIEYPKKYEHDDASFLMRYLLYSKSYYGVNKKLYNYFVYNKNSVMGRLYTNQNKNHEFDFCHALDEDLSFLSKRDDISDKLKLKFINKFIYHIQYFYTILPAERQDKAHKYILKLIKNNKILLQNPAFSQLLGCKNRNELNSRFRYLFGTLDLKYWY